MGRIRAGSGRPNPIRLRQRSVPAQFPSDGSNQPMSAWSQTFTFLDGEWLEGNAPIVGRPHPRLLAGFERVRRRARLRGGDARSRQALRAAQPLGQGHVSQADDERRGDDRTGARGDEEIQARGRTLYPPDVLGRARLAHVLGPARPRFDPLLPLSLRSAAASADRRRRSPARLSPSRSASPCRSKPRPAASIPTTRAR